MRQFYGRLEKNAFFLQEKPMSIKFLVLGGVFWVFFGGGSADFIFMGARIFLIYVYGFFPLLSKEEKRTRPPPTDNLLENLSGCNEKLSRPVVDTKTLLKNRKTISNTEIFPLSPPFFRQRKVPH